MKWLVREAGAVLASGTTGISLISSALCGWHLQNHCGALWLQDVPIGYFSPSRKEEPLLEKMKKGVFIAILSLQDNGPLQDPGDFHVLAQEKSFRHFPNQLSNAGPILSVYSCLFYVFLTVLGKQTVLRPGQRGCRWGPTKPGIDPNPRTLH